MVQIYKEKVALAVKKEYCYIKAVKWEVTETAQGLYGLVTRSSHRAEADLLTTRSCCVILPANLIHIFTYQSLSHEGAGGS